MKTSLVLFAALLCVSMITVSAIELSETDYQREFSSFIKKYHKVFPADSFFNRYNIFKQNLNRINEHNELSGASWTMAINEYADLTWDEFRAMKIEGGIQNKRNDFARSQMVDSELLSIKAAKAVDWRNATTVNGKRLPNGAVTPVKNQGQCGSCWSFSTTGSVEGAHAIATGKLVSLSEQQLMDCSHPQGNQGCEGGLMDQAFEFIIQNKGICSENSYPYQGVDESCQTGCTSVATISSYKDIPPQSENLIVNAVNKGPVSIAIEADQQAFQFYSGGVFNAPCGQQLDHGVLIVGYGYDTASGLNYWIVKNSWGQSWGANGYIYMVRGQNECGLADMASYPVV